jgi:hypothetical protein
MTKDDAKQFSALIGNVYSFYRQDASQFAVGVWWEAMKNYDFAAVSEALSKHCVNPDTGQFMPKPADVVRMLQGSTKDTALQAWTKVDKAIRSVGTYATVCFDDPLIHRVISDMGGWISFGSKDEEDWVFVGKEFENRYRGYASRNEKPEYPPVLTGMSDSHNHKMGFNSQEPRLIGDPEKARLVYKSGSSMVLQVSSLGDSSYQVAAKLIESSKRKD